MKATYPLTGLATVLFTASTALCQLPATGEIIAGKIDSLTLNDPSDVWSGGTIAVGGKIVTIPRNLLIDLPANRLSLQQLFADAPPRYQAAGESGLAALDTTGDGGGFATILANRNSFGNVIAGDVFIEKGQEAVAGTVTYINYDEGYFRIDGIVGDDTTGTMVRINDPTGRHTVQLGRGTDGGPNGSPDPRFGLDPDNYTITFSTGYPAGIPSTVPVGQREGFQAGTDNPNAASNQNGVGDPFCPANNRGGVTAADSRRFAPILIGDSINCEGNFEDVGGVRFLSVHTLMVRAAIATQNTPTQPDYFIFDEVEWDVPGFQNQRVRSLMIGFSTLAPAQVDLYALYIDPLTGENHESVMASTVNNPNNVNQGLGGPGDIFKIVYDLDFTEAVTGRVRPDRTPGQILTNAGFGSLFPLGVGNFEDNFKIMSPIARELIGRSRHKLTLAPGVITRDMNGNEATNGEYLTPIGLGHPEFVEIDLAGLQTPFIFEGIPWNLDRRLSPGGFDGALTPQPLDPFPVSGLDPTQQSPNVPANIAQRVFGFFPFSAVSRLNGVPAAPTAIPIVPTPAPQPVSLPPVAVRSAILARNAAGDGAISLLVQAQAGTVLQARLGTTVEPLPELQAGQFFGVVPVDSTSNVANLQIVALSGSAPPITTAPVSDIVTIGRALFTPAKTGGGTLEVRASTSDQFSWPACHVFGLDGSPLGPMTGGVMRITVPFPPAAVTVVSSGGGVAAMPVTTGRAR